MVGNCVRKDHLDGKYTPRYFAESFIIPWGRKMVEFCTDNTLPSGRQKYSYRDE